MGSPFERWLAGRLSKFERTPRLEGSILSGRILQYLARRLVVMVGNRILNYGLHLLEAFVLVRSFGGPILVRSFVVSVGCQVALGVHWTITEVMRDALRRALSKRRQRQISSSWLTVSYIAALVWCAVGFGLINALSPDEPGVWVLELYAMACVARTGSDFVVRTYFGAAYAFGRVYRPSIVIWGPQVLSFLLLLFCSRYWGAFGVVIAMVVAAPIGRLLSIYFARRTMLLARRPEPMIGWRFVSRRHFPLGAIVLAAAGGFFQRIGALSVIAVAAASADPALVMVAFCLAPLLNGASVIAQIFYPDLKRLESLASLLLFRRLLLGTVVAAMGVAGIFYGLGAIGIEVLRRAGWMSAMPPQFGPLLVALAVSSAIQTGLLARGRFTGLIVSGLGGLPILFWVFEPALTIALFALSLLFGAWWTLRAISDPSPLPRSWRRLPALDWFRADGKRLTKLERADVLEKLQTRLPRAALWIDGPLLHLARPVNDPGGASELLLISAGQLGPIRHQRTSPRAIEERLRLVQSAQPKPVEILAEFKTRFPAGLVIPLARTGPRLETRQLHALWQDAVAGRRAARRRAQREYDVAVLTRGPVFEYLLCMPSSAPPLERTAWRAFLRRSGSVSEATGGS